MIARHENHYDDGGDDDRLSYLFSLGIIVKGL